MNKTQWVEEYGYFLVMDSTETKILAYIYKNGALVRPNGIVEWYPTADAAYANI